MSVEIFRLDLVSLTPASSRCCFIRQAVASFRLSGCYRTATYLLSIAIFALRSGYFACCGRQCDSFLVAAGFDPTRFNEAPRIDQEVILLRVLGPVALPQDADMVRTRIEHHQRRRAEERLPGDGNDGLDPITRSELQWGGLRCRVLGTFFMQDDQLRLDSDVETFMSLPRMRAYKPRVDALARIVNHVNPEVRARGRFRLRAK